MKTHLEAEQVDWPLSTLLSYCWACTPQALQEPMFALKTFILKDARLGTVPTYLPVQPYGQDVAGIAVVTDLCAFLEVVHVHLARLGMADHHHQAAGEEALHDVNVRDFICGEAAGELHG